MRKTAASTSSSGRRICPPQSSRKARSSCATSSSASTSSTRKPPVLLSTTNTPTNQTRYFRTGLYKAPLPLITGKEAAGTILATGPSHPATHPLQPGVRVAYVADHAYAALTAVPASSATPIPDGLPTKTAAASLLQGLTALTFVRNVAGLQLPSPFKEGEEGPWVLVHAAAGGTGSVLVQLLAAHGARVIGTAGSEAKCAIARANGAGWVVDSSHGSGEVVKKVLEITGGKGVDVIFDGVGKATFDGDLEMVARKGTVAVFGNAVSACFFLSA